MAVRATETRSICGHAANNTIKRIDAFYARSLTDHKRIGEWRLTHERGMPGIGRRELEETQRVQGTRGLPINPNPR